VTGSPKSWNDAGRPGLILILIALAAAIPRLLLGASQSIEYDGYWDIFVARQDDWGRFWAEAFALAHPPLYFLLLKPFLHFGHSPLVYRSLSILAGVASVFQVGWIARKVTGSNIRSYQSALVWACAAGNHCFL
jgi:4-amino-4-deoxy-L-arabinose transferase-like glycosyltransferase